MDESPPLWEVQHRARQCICARCGRQYTAHTANSKYCGAQCAGGAQQDRRSARQKDRSILRRPTARVYEGKGIQKAVEAQISQGPASVWEIGKNLGLEEPQVRTALTSLRLAGKAEPLGKSVWRRVGAPAGPAHVGAPDPRPV